MGGQTVFELRHAKPTEGKEEGATRAASEKAITGQRERLNAKHAQRNHTENSFTMRKKSLSF